jgi:hypothetical protein
VRRQLGRKHHSSPARIRSHTRPSGCNRSRSRSRSRSRIRSRHNHTLDHNTRGRSRSCKRDIHSRTPRERPLPRSQRHRSHRPAATTAAGSMRWRFRRDTHVGARRTPGSSGRILQNRLKFRNPSRLLWNDRHLERLPDSVTNLRSCSMRSKLLLGMAAPAIAALTLATTSVPASARWGGWGWGGAALAAAAEPEEGHPPAV